MKIRRDRDESLAGEFIADGELPVILAGGAGHNDNHACLSVARWIRNLRVDLRVANREIHPLGADRRPGQRRPGGVEAGEIAVRFAVEAADLARTLGAALRPRLGRRHDADAFMSHVVVGRKRDQPGMVFEARVQEVDRVRPPLLGTFERGVAEFDTFRREGHAREASDAGVACVHTNMQAIIRMATRFIHPPRERNANKSRCTRQVCTWWRCVYSSYAPNQALPVIYLWQE